MRALALSLLFFLSAAEVCAQEPMSAPPAEPEQQRAGPVAPQLPQKPEPRPEPEKDAGGAKNEAGGAQGEAGGVKPPLRIELQRPRHRFWDATNKNLFAGVFAARALDFASTLNMRARGRDEILLSNEVVDNKPAFVAIELGATAASVGISYWLHRKNHHTLERWVSILHISVGGFGGVRNYMLETRRPAPAPGAAPRQFAH